MQGESPEAGRDDAPGLRYGAVRLWSALCVAGLLLIVLGFWKDWPLTVGVLLLGGASVCTVMALRACGSGLTLSRLVEAESRNPKEQHALVIARGAVLCAITGLFLVVSRIDLAQGRIERAEARRTSVQSSAALEARLLLDDVKGLESKMQAVADSAAKEFREAYSKAPVSKRREIVEKWESAAVTRPIAFMVRQALEVEKDPALRLRLVRLVEVFAEIPLVDSGARSASDEEVGRAIEAIDAWLAQKGTK